MSLRDQAAADLRAILEDTAGGFALALAVTDPAGLEVAVSGRADDIGQTIDPETGQAVAGRRASCSFAVATLTAAGIAIPRAIVDAASKPWLVTWTDLDGIERTYKIVEVMHDKELRIVTCLLESFKTA